MSTRIDLLDVLVLVGALLIVVGSYVLAGLGVAIIVAGLLMLAAGIVGAIVKGQ